MSDTKQAYPLVSFVVPCYNYGRYLPDCLRSILSLEGGYDFEIVAIDDCSTDNTFDVLRAFAYKRFRIIRHEQNRGHIFTVNEGLKEARGRFVARIDPDDRYRSCFLSETLSKFEANSEVGFVYGDAALITESGEITVQKCDKIHGGRDFKGNELVPILEKNFICAPTGIGRREAWLSAWPVPDGLAFNDWYFNVMLARRYEFYYVNKVLADYRVHSLNHHARIVRDRSEETSILRVLNRVFQEAEADSALEQAKHRAKGRIYAAQYLDFADKYFSCGMNADARRCYFNAIRQQPSYLLTTPALRRLLATFFSRRLYEASKGIIKPVIG